MDDNEKKIDENMEKESNKFTGEMPKSFTEVIEKYGGAIIGGIVAILLCFTHLYKLVLAVVIVFAGIFIGNYIQKNKDSVKERLKELIDKF